MIDVSEHKVGSSNMKEAINEICPGWEFVHNSEFCNVGRILVIWNPNEGKNSSIRLSTLEIVQTNS